MGEIVEIVQVQTTVGSVAAGEALAHLLVERRLAACVQVGAIRSTYRWHGAIERADELLVTAKTTAIRATATIDAIEANHAYDVPEIVIVPVAEASADYRAWVAEAVT